MTAPAPLTPQALDGLEETMAAVQKGGLTNRLVGQYRIPITDGLGPAGGEEPNNADEFVRSFPTPPIQKEAAEVLGVLLRALPALIAAARAGEEMREAAERVLRGLNARIERADKSAVPVFDGIADLHDAVCRCRALSKEQPQ